MVEPSVPCPVPSEQQPLQEYEQMRAAWLYRWAMLAPAPYWRKLGWIWAWSWLAAGPIAAASFAPARAPVQFAIAGGVGAALPVVLVLLRIYSGWAYVCDRLARDAVPYEESGWYDGQTWVKPPEVLTRDRLVAEYQVQPLLRRLRATFAVVLGVAAAAIAVWSLAARTAPWLH